ncbi:MAG: chaperone modulator CbpM [Betaproteobacteria bacterium]
MTLTVEKALYVEEQGQVTYAELVATADMPEHVVRELVRYGALAPIDAAAAQPPQWRFRAEALLIVRKARGLRRELDLDAHAVSIVLSYVERIDALEAELRELRARRGG